MSIEIPDYTTIRCQHCGHRWSIYGSNECPRCFPSEIKDLTKNKNKTGDMSKKINDISKLSSKNIIDEFTELSSSIHKLKKTTHDATLAILNLAAEIIKDLAAKNKKLKKENDELLDECGSLQHAYIIGWKNGKAGLPCEIKMQYPEIYKYKWVKIEE